jgi:hypothetical protein
MVITGVVILAAAGIAAAFATGLIPLRGTGSGRPVATPHILTDAEAVIYAFFREVRDPRAEYRVTTEAETRYRGAGDEIAPVAVANDIRIYREDWGGVETVTSDEASVEYRMVLVDGVGYVSEDGGDWASTEIPDRLQPISPFRRISTVTEVEYLGSETVDGRPVHRLLVTKWLGGRDFSDPLRRFGRIVSQESRMEVIVDSFGVPSLAELDIKVVASDGSERLTIEGHATYRFSDWDEVEPITAPGTITDPAT